MECRTPLTMKIEAPPPPPGQSSTPEHHHKENQPQHARMSPALQRRQQLVQNRYGRHPPDITPPKPGPNIIKQRLPLPKNAVLLSLIQASEPARRRAMVDSPPEVPPKIYRESSTTTERFQSTAPTNNVRDPVTPPKLLGRSEIPGKPSLLPKFSKGSTLFVDTGLGTTSSSSEGHMDDEKIEEHQIRVGTYLEGGPCGTYAVAVKTGLLVYPTLFEHALPNTLGANSKDDSPNASQTTDQWKRDVDELVKSSYRKKQEMQMKLEEFGDKKMPSKTQSLSSSLFEGDEWQVDASIDEEEKPCVGLGLSSSYREHCEDRDDDVCLGLSASFSRSHDRSLPGGANDDSNLKQPLPLTHATSFTRQLSVPIARPHSKKDSCDDFDRPLMRLKYGDRVQVVSMDSRGWVKLARGYGYIRLQNDKQLVKGEFDFLLELMETFLIVMRLINCFVIFDTVGGTSDRACQIEATLHELSTERDRLKNEQTKLERLAAGLMIDLQSTLITSDDHVICSAPEGMPRIDSDLELSTRRGGKPSLDDISVNSRSPEPLPVRTTNISASSSAIPDIRMTKSHSPSRAVRTVGAGASSPPPDPRLSTPTRVNFRTGLSGHRALMSSNTHPHDFIGTPGSVRSMSNHSGISKSKKATRPRASIY